jgi:hypothetical protein
LPAAERCGFRAGDRELSAGLRLAAWGMVLAADGSGGSVSVDDDKFHLRKTGDRQGYPWYLTGSRLWNACYFDSFEGARIYLCKWPNVNREDSVNVTK